MCAQQTPTKKQDGNNDKIMINNEDGEIDQIRWRLLEAQRMTGRCVRLVKKVKSKCQTKPDRRCSLVFVWLVS